MCHHGCGCGSFFNTQGSKSKETKKEKEKEEFEFQGNAIHNGSVVPYFKIKPSDSTYADDKTPPDGKVWEKGPLSGN